MLRRLRIDNFVLIREADLVFAPGLNAVTGETGAGKTILAQAIGLLLGARGDASYVGPAGEEAYVEAELDLRDDLLGDDELEAIAELRPSGEEGLVAARRVFVDGRTRAYAWGRSVAREDLARLVERLLAMSGQFEQRRLGRHSFQLDVLDAFVGEGHLRRRAELARAWRDHAAARRRHDEVARAAAGESERLDELTELVARTKGLEADTEERLRSERTRLRHVAELAGAAGAAAEALAPELSEGEGAAELAARAAYALSPASAIARDLAAVETEVREAEVVLREAASTLRGFLASLEADPGRLEQVEADLDGIAETRRRFRAASYGELLERARAARSELEGLDGACDALALRERALAETRARATRLAAELSAARARAAPAFASEVAGALAGLALGGEFRVDVGRRELGASGVDDVSFLVRPNAGLPFAPVAETASGGELSRIALALRTVAHAARAEPTIVFDEIDAGIGGRTAHAVAAALRALAERAQVVTITHLPQIASAADAHFRVEKVAGDPTHTRIAQLDEGERREELERMLGGAEFLSALR
ncbi:MAG: AAA family ATPase [Actinomycetota bacterium]|nr:AAA family ATPase [Actinomycetota bacterium]